MRNQSVEHHAQPNSKTMRKMRVLPIGHKKALNFLSLFFLALFGKSSVLHPLSLPFSEGDAHADTVHLFCTTRNNQKYDRFG